MQENIERRTVVLSANATRLVNRTLAKVLTTTLRQIQKNHQKRQTPQDRRSVKESVNHSVPTDGLDLSGDTRLFDHMTRKYNIDYAFHETGPDKYLLFFKAGQADAITTCFGEYIGLVLSRGRSRHPPVLRQLKTFTDRERTRPW